MALQHRQAVLEAATARFSERGWAASVRDTASTAGVSVETVYVHFGSKVDLLNRVMDVAVVGDHDPVALVDRADPEPVPHTTNPSEVQKYARRAGRTIPVALADGVRNGILGFSPRNVDRAGGKRVAVVPHQTALFLSGSLP